MRPRAETMRAPTLLEHHVLIRCEPAAVFDYVSTPARWPEWHPASLGLESGAERPLTAGARFEEDIRAGGRHGHLSWTVRTAERPRLWVADAVASNGVRLTLSYRLGPVPEGTRFARTLEYAMPNALWGLLNWLLLRRRIEAESADSLQRLKAVLESGNL